MITMVIQQFLYTENLVKVCFFKVYCAQIGNPILIFGSTDLEKLISILILQTKTIKIILNTIWCFISCLN